jgi:hypothetical protein
MLSLQCRAVRLAAVIVLVFAARTTRADTFTIVTKNLDGTPITVGEDATVNLRVFKLNASTAPVAQGQLTQLTMARGGEIAVGATRARSAAGELQFTFNLMPNNPVLTANASPNKVILIVFSRDGVDTAAVPFMVVSNQTHSFSVAVPLASDLMQDYPCPHEYVSGCCQVVCPKHGWIFSRRR